MIDVAHIEVLDTDITKLEVDAIANAANTQLKHGGGVAAAISRAGGPSIQAESSWSRPDRARRGRGDIRWRDAVSLGDPRGDDGIGPATPTSAEIIRAATAATLRKASELGARSLALVAFGTGVGGFPLDEAARIEIDEVSRYLQAGGSAIERVVFAVRGSEARAAFESALAAG